MVNSIICYECTDCPQPFTENYPYVTITNNTNFLAKCTTTVVNLSDGRRFVSKGSVFFCPTQTTQADVKIYCCDHDYCNLSIRIGPSILLFLFIFIRIYFINIQY
ncbi:unnamed protein product [Rotaria sp. Silwood1]|nr:unnamed protein product [Rotaria sp. Silwood1]CAF1521149.1 unnamed protein product [Rotaria sp. Silwood1]CAF1522866.1 unnamed protein product [Rotaria sp. Silwood1]CAF3734369.1 unnamed protein product [Rotaria sp. Silwood1]CAF4684518.1 unnamed protein product [Rotaria sp. Silwood1]